MVVYETPSRLPDPHSTGDIPIDDGMKNLICSSVLCATLFSGSGPAYAGYAGNVSALQYLSPEPGARMVTPQTNIILRSPLIIDPATLQTAAPMTVTGSTSGPHSGELILSDDGRTLVFKSAVQFALGEAVSVSTPHGLRSRDGKDIGQKQFTFSIKDREVAGSDIYLTALYGVEGIPGRSDFLSYRPSVGERQRTVAGMDSVPLDFPHIQASVYGAPSPGRIFIADMVLSGPNISYLMILDDNGTPIFYRRTPGDAFDFKMQLNGLLTYCDISRRGYFALNDAYAEVDSFRCGNGYTTDIHDLRILRNGHAVLMSYDPEVVNMSTIVPGGDTAAVVFGLIVQELDQNKNVVFQWRSWDHFQITDATHENLMAHVIDYVHGNAIDVDTDGNLLLSGRHMDEVTKISRETGEIIWRWGGRHNQFVINNDTIFFSHQHAVRRIGNGHITMFDNGNFHTPPFSRAMEYEVDELHKVATVVWQYRHSPDIFGLALGYVQRLPSGNTLIGWGAAVPSAMEVQPDGTIVSELSITDPLKYSYRAYRFIWNPASVQVPATTPSTFSLLQNYPNPFNSATTIPFQLAQASDVRLTVFDLLGREVMSVLAGERMEAGEHRVTLDASHLASGLYFYRLNAGAQSLIRKAILLR